MSVKKLFRLLMVTSSIFTFLANINCGISLAEREKTGLNFKKYEFWVEKCRLLKNNQQYSEALSACEQAISLKPKKDNIQLWLTRGDALLELNQYNEAAISYNWVLQIDKKNVPALIQKCSALLGLGKYEDALTSCDLALERRDNWQNIKQVKNYWGNLTLAKALYVKGSVFRKQKEYKKAISSFDDALKQDDNFALAYAGKCGVLVDNKEYQNADEFCEKAVEKFEDSESMNQQSNPNTYRNANYAIIWFERGRVKQKLKEQQEALNNFNVAIQVNPKYSQALARKSEILNKMGRYQEALDECDRALKGDKQWRDRKGLAYVWYQRSAALLGLQKYEEALASSEKAIAIRPKYAEAWNNKAVSLWKLGQYEAAERAIKTAVMNYSGSVYAQGYANRGRILSSLQRYREALLAYELVSKNIKSLESRTVHRFWLNKAVTEMRLDDYQAARKSINWSISKGGSFAAFYNKAIILSKLGMNKEAIEAFEQANIFNPDNYLVLTGKAIALMKLGNSDKYKDALQELDKVLVINPSYQLAISKRKELITKMQNEVTSSIDKYTKLMNALEKNSILKDTK